jgi:hypothetical protein
MHEMAWAISTLHRVEAVPPVKLVGFIDFCTRLDPLFSACCDLWLSIQA